MSGPAPGDLELLRSFVNTTDPDEGTDEIDTPERLSEWLTDRSLLDEATRADEEAHGRALEFREAIRALGMANGGADLDPGVVATLNRLADSVSLSVRLKPDGDTELRAGGHGVDHSLGRLFSIMYTANVDGTFPRLKGCANDTCRWLFYDRSKNRSKKWCDMQTCGNVINARAYRHRHRHS